MNFQRMKSLSAFTVVKMVVCLMILVSCGGDEDPKKPSFDEYEYAGALKATITSNGTPSESEGYVTVDEKEGEITIELMAGSMTGTVEKTEDGYTFTITDVSGGFADVTNLTGTIDIITGIITFSGTNPGGSSVTSTGEATPILQTDGGWDDLEKAAVIFTHSEPGLLATISINGEIVTGLNAHYHQGGVCDSYYALWNTLRFNYDEETISELFCNSGTLKGLDGNPAEFTDCNTIRYVLDKNEDYEYTVEWSNGVVTTGHFSTGGGGTMKAVCPSVGSGGSGGSCSVKANTFKIGSKVYNAIITECDSDGSEYYLYAESSDESELEIMLPSLPVANASYTILNAESFGGSLEAGKAILYAYREGSETDYYSTGGGSLIVTIVNGDIKVEFCSVPMKDFDSNTTLKIAGKLTCD